MQMPKRPKPSLPPPLPDWFPRGAALLRDPALNKGTAFTEAEREALGLRGLLPPHVATQAVQAARVLENFHRLQTPLAKYILLESLQDRNEALFFRVITDRAAGDIKASTLSADLKAQVTEGRCVGGLAGITITFREKRDVEYAKTLIALRLAAR